LASSDTSEATVAATVTIAANQTSTTFDVTAIDDASADGSQTVTLTASATNFTSGTTSVTVTDDDTTAGTVRIHDIQGAAHTSPLAGQTVPTYLGLSPLFVLMAFICKTPILMPMMQHQKGFLSSPPQHLLLPW
jgi:predicted extracellular nuclease